MSLFSNQRGEIISTCQSMIDRCTQSVNERSGNNTDPVWTFDYPDPTKSRLEGTRLEILGVIGRYTYGLRLICTQIDTRDC